MKVEKYKINCMRCIVHKAEILLTLAARDEYKLSASLL